MNKWIPVNVRLPHRQDIPNFRPEFDSINVLITYLSEPKPGYTFSEEDKVMLTHTCAAKYDFVNRHFTTIQYADILPGTITAWMYYPEPYFEEAE